MSKLILSDRQKSLFSWVKEQHGDQKRKYTFEPYWHHLQNVAALVQEHALEVKLGVEVALCHDVIEDTPVTPGLLKEKLLNFGYTGPETKEIIEDVLHITDRYTHEAFPNLNRRKRKELEAEKLIMASPSAQTVKYADVIDNLSTIADHDPGFARVYLSEKDLYFHKMNKGNQVLYKMASDAAEQAKLKSGYH